LEWDSETPGFKESGYLPEALANYLALLGWNPGGEKELFSLDELIDLFSLKEITKAGGRFDPERCRWFNEQHLHKADSAIVEDSLNQLLEQKGIDSTSVSTASVVGLVQNRLTLLSDIWEESHFFFIAPSEYDEKAVRKQWKDETNDILSQVMLIIKEAKDTRAETLSASIKLWASKNDVKLGMVMAPLRIALIGALKGPDIFAVCAVLGKTECTTRILGAIEKI
jgi:glutamyl-tRNA synthetase